MLATHGRGIWIIDDISPWRALTPAVMEHTAAFLPVPPAVLASDCLNRRGDLADDEPMQFDFGTRVIDVDADQMGVVLILVSLPRGRPCGAGVG